MVRLVLPERFELLLADGPVFDLYAAGPVAGAGQPGWRGLGAGRDVACSAADAARLGLDLDARPSVDYVTRKTQNGQFALTEADGWPCIVAVPAYCRA